MKPQPYRLAFASAPSLKPEVNTVLARQFANADQMFEILFKDAGSPTAPAPDTDPTAATAPAGTNTTQVATTAFVNGARPASVISLIRRACRAL
jgi:hypothetical protein